MPVVWVHNKEAVGALLKESGIAADLERRAHKIADAAGEGFEVEVTTTATRAHAIVRAATWAARHAEATQRVLTRAIDAGR